MARIYKTIDFEHEGKRYSVKLHFKLIQRIENAGISLVGEVDRWNEGKPRLTYFAQALSFIYAEAGIDRTDESIFEELMTAGADEYLKMVKMAIDCAVPFQSDLPVPETNLEEDSKKK